MKSRMRIAFFSVLLAAIILAACAPSAKSNTAPQRDVAAATAAPDMYALQGQEVAAPASGNPLPESKALPAADGAAVNTLPDTSNLPTNVDTTTGTIHIK